MAVATKKKTTVDVIAKRKARYDKHLTRTSKTTREVSCIKGRSLSKKAKAPATEPA